MKETKWMTKNATEYKWRLLHIIM
uniref:Uncharacterized protein n=1 Tax=Anguilla anguilla TaxID=7936 RepID=A0A0E9UBF3_ANGAN